MRIPRFGASAPPVTDEPPAAKTTPAEGVKTLGQDAQARLNAAQQQAAAAKAPQGRMARLRGKMSRRTQDLSVGVPGSGVTRDRAVRDATPQLASVDHDETPEFPELQRSRQLLRYADASLATLEQSKISLWQRPAPGHHRQRLTRLFPWLQPKALREMAAINGATPAKTPPEGDELPQSREAIAAEASKIQQHISDQRLLLQTAVEVLEQLYTRRNQAQQQHDDAATQRLQPQIALAEQQAAQRQAELVTTLEQPAIMALERISAHADSADQQLAFSRQRLAELRDAASQLTSSSVEQREDIQQQLAANREKISALMVLANGMENGYRQLHEADSALAHLHDAEARGDASEQLQSDILRQLLLQRSAQSSLLEHISQLEALEIDSASAETGIARALEKLNTQQGQLLKQHNLAQRQWQHASEAARKLADVPTASAAPAAPAGETADKAALNALKAEANQARLDSLQRLQDGPLSTQMHALIDRLTADPALTKQPGWMVADVVQSALLPVCQPASLAGQVLEALAQHPAQHWATVPAPHDRLTSALVAFNHKMSTLPRGADILQLLSANGSTPPDGEVSKSLRTLWSADRALTHEQDAGVIRWLQDARSVAANKLAGNEQPVDDVKLAAYNAVRNGYTSNAPGTPYDVDNQRLLKATREWVFRAMAEPPEDGKEGPRLLPNVQKNPFHHRVLDRAMDITDGMDMNSLRSQSDKLVSDRLVQLAPLITHASDHPEPATRELAQSAQQLVSLLEKSAARGEHLSRLIPGSSERRQLRRQREQPDATALSGKLRARFSPAELPAALEEMFEQKLSCFEMVNRLHEQLNSALPVSQRQPAAALSADDERSLQLLKSLHFQGKEDILTFFRPLIEGSRLRDRVRLGEGGTLGGGLPVLPWNTVFPVAPTFSFELARTDEAYAQLFMPIIGMELSFGKSKTTAGEASVGVNAGASVAPGVSLQGGARATLRGQQTESDATLIRFFRRRFQDDEMRKKMYTALESMVRWDDLKPEQGRAFSGPLEAVLARSPDVSMSHVSSESNNLGITGTAYGRLPFVSHAGQAMTGQTVSDEFSVSQMHDRTRDKRQESGGTVRINDYRGETTTQRTRLGAALNASPLSNAPQTEGAGVSGRYGIPAQLGVTRDIAWHQQRNELSLYTIEDKQDADIDRHSSTVADMQHELTVNRDAWLMRCIETLELDPDKRDRADLREQATGILDEFEQKLADLAENSNYCLYNENYSLRGETGAEIDGYRALAQLAREAGDDTRAAGLERHSGTLLSTRGSWRPLMLIVRERARENATTGIRSALRLQHNRNNDGLRTALQFPPP